MSATDTSTVLATQVYRVYIKATPEKVWEAITDPEWTNRYGYTGFTYYEPLEKGGSMRVVPNDEFRAQAEAYGGPLPEAIVDGEVLEVDPPKRLKTTWRMLMDPAIAEEPHSTITYDILDLGNGSVRLTLTHEMPESPLTAELVSGIHEDEGQGGGGGWAWVLSDLKSLLETGSVLAAE